MNTSAASSSILCILLEELKLTCRPRLLTVNVVHVRQQVMCFHFHKQGWFPRLHRMCLIPCRWDVYRQEEHQDVCFFLIGQRWVLPWWAIPWELGDGSGQYPSSWPVFDEACFSWTVMDLVFLLGIFRFNSCYFPHRADNVSHGWRACPSYPMFNQVNHQK